MACKGCTGLEICLGGTLCCLGFENDCGDGCDGLAVGQSRLQIDALGNLELCSNVGGVCDCVIMAMGTDSLVDNGGGAFVHTASDGVITVIDICTELNNCTIENLGNVVAGAINGQFLQFNGTNWIPITMPSDSLVSNGVGIFTHTAVNGAITIIDICTELNNCTVENLGNVTAGAAVGEALIFDGVNWIPTTIPLMADSLVNNANGSFTHTASDGVITVFDICTEMTHCTVENLGNVAAGAVLGQALIYNGANWIPTTIPTVNDILVNNGDGTYTHTSTAGVAVIIDVCAAQILGGCFDTFVFDGTNTLTHTDTRGNVVAVNICTQVLPNCTIENLGNVTPGAVANQVLVFNGATWTPQNFANDVLVNNGDGTYTHTSTAGVAVIIDVCAAMLAAGCVDSMVNNVDGTYTHTNTQGIIQIVDICGTLAFCTIEQLGNVAAGAVANQILIFNGATWTPQNFANDVLVNNGDGTYTHTSTTGVAVIIDVCAAILAGGCSDTLVNNGDGTFTHTAVDTTPVIIDICTMLGDGNCTALLDAIFGVGTAGIAAPIVGGAVRTLIEPATLSVITNTTLVPMQCTVTFTDTQLSAENLAGVVEELQLAIEYTIDGGATWIAPAGSQARVTLDVAGSPGAFQNVNAAGITLALTIPAGGNQTVGFRRFIDSPTLGFTGLAFADSTIATSTCIAIPT